MLYTKLLAYLYRAFDSDHEGAQKICPWMYWSCELDQLNTVPFTLTYILLKLC